MLKLSKKIALPLIAVLLIGTGVGGYFLFKNFQIPKYFVDKYPELIEYCDTQESENGLKVSCKALMLDIKPNVSDGTPSLTSLVIANDEELKEYTITEKEEVFAWINDVLQYKKLKPIVINIQYTKGSLLKYSLSNITFEEIPETYIQEIVNRDIEEIMGMDKSSTTILNSFDFCPRPETLPDYVIKKEEYTKYWNENILSEEEYKNGYNYSLDDTIIRLLFACDSARNVGYSHFCKNIEDKDQSSILKNNLPNQFSLEDNSEELNTAILKAISYLYDITLIKENNTKFISENSITSLLLTMIRDSIQREEILCSLDKIQNRAEEGASQIDNLDENIGNSKSTICINLLQDSIYDKTGIFLKYRFDTVSKDFLIFNRCNNLKLYID